MAEDMRVLDEMLADGGLKVGSEEVEAYKYNYRCNFTNITTDITTSNVSFAAAEQNDFPVHPGAARPGAAAHVFLVVAFLCQKTVDIYQINISNLLSDNVPKA